jgi:hypothetical protein
MVVWQRLHAKVIFFIGQLAILVGDRLLKYHLNNVNPKNILFLRRHSHEFCNLS